MNQTNHKDSYGLQLSTGSPIAAERYREGIALMLSAWPSAAELLGAAVEADPDFALAHAALARLDALAARRVEAKTRMALAARLAEQGASERERSHVEALALSISGETQKALAHALEHADRWPRDTVVLGLPLGAFGLFAFSGMPNHDQARVDLCERHAAHFEADDWWFLTYHGWSLAENGEVARGRGLLERACEIRADNANGIHALLHAMFESGAHREAEALISAWLPGYDRAGLLHGHISWHAALSALERGDAAEAMAIYLGSVQPSISKGAPINVVTDGASLLWRMDAYGHPVGEEHWRELASFALLAFPRPGHAFTDAHMAMIETSTQDDAGITRRCEALEDSIEHGAHLAGPVVPALCRAASAFRNRNFAECVTLMSPIVQDVARIGGSGAQREVFEDTLLIALMHSGEVVRAKTLLDHRLHRRPSTRDLYWRSQLGA
jgi:tetratricopeptide (TPR) repeat protein